MTIKKLLHKFEKSPEEKLREVQELFDLLRSKSLDSYERFMKRELSEEVFRETDKSNHWYFLRDLARVLGKQFPFPNEENRSS